jgi:hypothetical protein
MHQYLDSDGSGTSPTCVSPTIGAERLQAATQWLQQNNLKGFLGELGAGSNGMITSFELLWGSGIYVAIPSGLYFRRSGRFVLDATIRRLAWCTLVGCWAMVGNGE